MHSSRCMSPLANGAIGQEKGRTMDDTRIETGGITNKEILR